MSHTNEDMASWRLKMNKIIFDADTFSGKFFDVALLWAIIISVITVMLESVKAIDNRFGDILRIIEWVFTILFTFEYIARIICIGNPFRYMRSFFGIIDLLAIIPTYLSLFVVGTHYFVVIRSIRLLRVFRILKLARYMGEAKLLVQALRASRQKITVFLIAVLSMVMIAGTLMYLIEGSIEGAKTGFTSIPRSIYWAIVTLTTVGYGDIAPTTVLGQTMASLIMIMGYAIIAVPTGIVTVELSRAKSESDDVSAKVCLECSFEGHDEDAEYCKYCGMKL
ncbi:MAG: ion transporter [bacterium]|nr:ion transporter [bacterium]